MLNYHSIKPIHYHFYPQKTTLDKEELSNYRPILNLSEISKKQYEQRTTKSRLTEHLSAYCKHHSTETAIFYIRNYLVNAIGSQKYHVSVLLTSLLHLILSTITSLLSRLSSWFGITGTVVDWFTSYLSSHPFRVKCESSFSSLYICFVASRKYLFSAPGFYHVHSTPPLSVH